MSDLTDHEILLELHSDVKDVKETLDCMRQTIYGNGNMEGGLVTKSVLVEKRVDTIVKILMFVGGPFVAAVIIYLVGLLVK